MAGLTANAIWAQWRALLWSHPVIQYQVMCICVCVVKVDRELRSSPKKYVLCSVYIQMHGFSEACVSFELPQPPERELHRGHSGYSKRLMGEPKLRREMCIIICSPFHLPYCLHLGSLMLALHTQMDYIRTKYFQTWTLWNDRPFKIPLAECIILYVNSYLIGCGYISGKQVMNGKTKRKHLESLYSSDFHYGITDN